MKCLRCGTVIATESRFCSECGERISDPDACTADLPKPFGEDLLERMRRVFAGESLITEELVRVGVGVVYRALEQPIDRVVALKVLPLELGLTLRALERFRRWTRVAAATPQSVASVPLDMTRPNRARHETSRAGVGQLRRLPRRQRVAVRYALIVCWCLASATPAAGQREVDLALAQVRDWYEYLDVEWALPLLRELISPARPHALTRDQRGTANGYLGAFSDLRDQRVSAVVYFRAAIEAVPLTVLDSQRFQPAPVALLDDARVAVEMRVGLHRANR